MVVQNKTKKQQAESLELIMEVQVCELVVIVRAIGERDEKNYYCCCFLQLGPLCPIVIINSYGRLKEDSKGSQQGKSHDNSPSLTCQGLSVL